MCLIVAYGKSYKLCIFECFNNDQFGMLELKQVTATNKSNHSLKRHFCSQIFHYSNLFFANAPTLTHEQLSQRDNLNLLGTDNTLHSVGPREAHVNNSPHSCKSSSQRSLVSARWSHTHTLMLEHAMHLFFLLSVDSGALARSAAWPRAMVALKPRSFQTGTSQKATAAKYNIFSGDDLSASPCRSHPITVCF